MRTRRSSAARRSRACRRSKSKTAGAVGASRAEPTRRRNSARANCRRAPIAVYFRTDDLGRSTRAHRIATAEEILRVIYGDDLQAAPSASTASPRSFVWLEEHARIGDEIAALHAKAFEAVQLLATPAGRRARALARRSAHAARRAAGPDPRSHRQGAERTKTRSTRPTAAMVQARKRKRFFFCRGSCQLPQFCRSVIDSGS
jgi:hypothetical protein